ncbi:hypothetical protein [Novosphingobium sp. KA1]|uniref:hypothetical protein n=1 Tax=Novosphingobium sp. (strain KA1) TaxID=164608 RepID=UPI001A8EE461|nr:hypothetical protein [Novosphingobium sp. KA1]
MAAMLGTVTGCSSTYDIQAKMVDGKVTFVPDTGIFGGPDCIGSITVETEDGPPAAATPGDDLDAISRGTYWEETFASPSCENLFPITYGAKLVGPPFIYDDDTIKSVKPKPLLKGVIYTVSARSSGSAYGGGKFRLTNEGRIENLQR